MFEVLCEGLHDDDQAVAVNCCSALLGSRRQLPAAQMARVAIRAFSNSDKCEDCDRMLQKLLQAYDSQGGVSDMLLLLFKFSNRISREELPAELKRLPPAVAARLAAETWSTHASREAALEVMQELLRDSATRAAVFPLLQRGIRGLNGDNRRICQQLLDSSRTRDD